MLKKIFTITTYILIFLNFNLFAEENKKSLKIGLLAPFSGDYKELGQSIMFSLQLALDEIGDENIKIFPRDSGFKNDKKLLESIQSLKSEDIKIVIGPINFEDFKVLNNHKDMIFISPSNINPKVQDNVLSIGISLESQIKSIEKFIKKQKLSFMLNEDFPNQFIPVYTMVSFTNIPYNTALIRSEIQDRILDNLLLKLNNLDDYNKYLCTDIINKELSIINED